MCSVAGVARWLMDTRCAVVSQQGASLPKPAHFGGGAALAMREYALRRREDESGGFRQTSIRALRESPHSFRRLHEEKSAPARIE